MYEIECPNCGPAEQGSTYWACGTTEKELWACRSCGREWLVEIAVSAHTDLIETARAGGNA